ncbi:MAG: hypothetical protein Q8Q02_12380 [Nocardioides sp.]|nr:hypothetical protein [Nocardioides sp.]
MSRSHSSVASSRLVRGRRTTALLMTFFLVLAGGALTVPASDAAPMPPQTTAGAPGHEKARSLSTGDTTATG